MEDYKIEINNTFEGGAYHSPELAWESLKSAITLKYSYQRKTTDLTHIREGYPMILYCRKIAEFKVEGIEEIIERHYFVPIFIGYYKDTLTNNNLLDEIYSLQII